MPKTVILAGANIDNYQWLGDQIHQADRIICADSGLRHAHAMSIVPDIIIGDFDSVDQGMLAGYKDRSKIIHDADQNTTDLMKALSQCDGAGQVNIYGAVGGRADHDFSNILILMNIYDPDHIQIVTKNETRRVVKKSCEIKGKTGDYVGLFPLAPVTDFAVEGLQYKPEGLGGPYDFGWNGSCNMMTDAVARVSFSSGVILVTHSQN